MKRGKNAVVVYIFLLTFIIGLLFLNLSHTFMTVLNVTFLLTCQPADDRGFQFTPIHFAVSVLLLHSFTYQFLTSSPSIWKGVTSPSGRIHPFISKATTYNLTVCDVATLHVFYTTILYFLITSCCCNAFNWLILTWFKTLILDVNAHVYILYYQ